MKECTVIIPIIDLETEELVNLAKEAYKSVPKTTKVIVVGSETALNTFDVTGKNLTKTVCPDNNGYCHQVNFALNNVDTKYFSILEFDDKFTKTWFDNIEKHIKYMDKDMFAYFPLTELFDDSLKQTVGYANEAFLATSFSEKVGFMDLNSLTDYFGFNVSGAIFNTDEFKKLGGLKESMKLTFWYEFLLRALYKDKKIYVIPKVGCIHLINRIGSITYKYNEEMSEDEADWWVDTAKKEYFFTNDRNKTYEK